MGTPTPNQPKLTQPMSEKSKLPQLSGTGMFEVAYAPSDMGECTLSSCDSKIQKHDLFMAFIGKLTKQDTKLMGKPFHLKCFFQHLQEGKMKKYADSLDSIVDIKGYDSLKEEHQQEVKNCMLEFEKAMGKGVYGISGEKSTTKKSKGKQKQGKEIQQKGGIQQQQQQQQGKSQQKGKGKGGLAAKEKSLDEPDDNGKRKEASEHGKEVVSPTHKKKKREGQQIEI